MLGSGQRLQLEHDAGLWETWSGRRLRRQAMTDPKEQQRDEDLDLDAETVRDLEPDDSDAEKVEGGRPALPCSGGCPTASDC
jgi:hypothetical protein